MRTRLMTALLVLACSTSRADIATATFEDRYPGPNAVAVDFRGSGDRFSSGGFTFSNHYVPPSGGFGDFYSGFGVSSLVDNTLVNDPFGNSDFDHADAAYAPVPPGGSGA